MFKLTTETSFRLFNLSPSKKIFTRHLNVSQKMTEKMSQMTSPTKSIKETIIRDHRGIKNLWAMYQAEPSEEELQKIANTIIREISLHSACEEIVVYPMIEEKFGKDLANMMRQEHQQIKNMLYDLDQIGYVTNQGYTTKLEKIMSSLENHIQHEENDEIPQLESVLNFDEEGRLISSWFVTRKTAPTRPHPSAPDSGLAEATAGAFAKPLDATRDMTRSFVQVPYED